MEKVKVIQDRLNTTNSCQKSQTYVRRRHLEFEVDDWVYLNASPMKGVKRFCKKGKLSTQCVGPYEIFKRVGKVVYEFKFPNELALVHPVFRVSMLQ